METTDPLISAALKSLCLHWPAAVSFEALLAAARTAAAADASGRSAAEEAAALAEALMRAYRAGFLQLQVFPHAVTKVVSERPSVSRLARFMLEHGESAMNQLHVLMRFPDPLSRRLVQLSGWKP